MINRIGAKETINSNILPVHKNDGTQNPNFKGAGVLGLLQVCEQNPMINVAVIDLLSAILPRTIVESLTNGFAGFEAFRRESSGLIVNCMIPGLVSIGIAACLNNLIMPKGANMATCLADTSLIENATALYTNSKCKDKEADVLRKLFKNIEGINGTETVKFSEALTDAEINNYVKKFKDLSAQDLSRKQLEKEVKKITEEIAEKTHIHENIIVKNSKGNVKASNVTNLIKDTIKYLHEYGKATKVDPNVTMAEYAQKSIKLVRAKSVGALAIILPLAASMQFINRWITNKVSGTKGAPIYEDFGKGNVIESSDKSKEGLAKQKIISISTMLTACILSTMKMPSWNMFEFKGIFPTMDQARIISATTFASRMAAADDKNELREATVRDIATFASLYFLGDYAAKGAASIIEKKTGVKLLNDTKPIDKNANSIKKFWHWFKNVNIKSSEEVYSNTAEALKKEGITPDKKQLETIAKELKQAKHLRKTCQVANLGVSLLLLGLIIPIFTRRNTKKRHAEAVRMAQIDSSSKIDDTNEAEKISINYGMKHSA